MKKLFLLSTVLGGFLLTAAEEVPVKNFLNANSWRRQKTAQLVMENGKPCAVQLTKGTAFCSVSGMTYTIDGKGDINTLYEGISFEVKGDGSDEWSCVLIGGSRAFQSHFYFPLKNKEWTKYTVSFADMAPANDHTAGLCAKVPAGRLGTLTFNDHWNITWCNAKRQNFTYQVRNFALVKKAAPRYAYEKYSKALSLDAAVKKMKSGQKVQLLCFGDSITAGTGLRKTDKRYAMLLGEALEKKYNNPRIVSDCAAVGGARTKDSIAWLDRDLTKGLPDVATMLIGYNNRSGGQNAEMYQKQLELWIRHLLARTKGQTAIILIPTVPGVPRWFEQDDMAQTTYAVAKKYNCTVVPLDKAIKQLGPAVYRSKFLCDGVHPNQEGHQLFANEILKVFK